MHQYWHLFLVDMQAEVWCKGEKVEINSIIHVDYPSAILYVLLDRKKTIKVQWLIEYRGVGRGVSGTPL